MLVTLLCFKLAVKSQDANVESIAPAFPIDAGCLHTCVLHACGMLFGVSMSTLYA